MTTSEGNAPQLPNLAWILNADLEGDAMDKYRSHGWVIFKDIKYRKKRQWVARRVKRGKNMKRERGYFTEREAIAFVQLQIALTGGIIDRILELSDEQKLLLIDHIGFLQQTEVGSPAWQILQFISTANDFTLKTVIRLLGTIGTFEGKHTEQAIVEPLLRRLSDSRTIWTWGRVAEAAIAKKEADIAEVRLCKPEMADRQTKGRLQHLKTVARHAVEILGADTDIIETTREVIRHFRAKAGKIRAAEQGRKELADTTLDKMVNDLRDLVCMSGAKASGIDMSCFDIAKLARGKCTDFSLPAMDVARVMTAAALHDEQITVLLALMFFGGLRRKEAFLLKGSRIHLDRMTINIEKGATKTKSVGKDNVADGDGYERDVEISPTLYQWLVAFRSTWDVGSRRFCTLTESQYTTRLGRLREIAKVELWAEKDTGRHTLINCLYSLDLNIGLIKTLVGHSKASDSTKKHYLTVERIEDAHVLTQVVPSNLGIIDAPFPPSAKKTELGSFFNVPDWAEESVQDGIATMQDIAIEVRSALRKERM